MHDHEDIPELTDADLARARPFEQAFPDQHAAWKARGRPRLETPRKHIGFRLPAEIVDTIRASGRGYNARVEKVLRDALAKGELWRTVVFTADATVPSDRRAPLPRCMLFPRIPGVSPTVGATHA